MAMKLDAAHALIQRACELYDAGAHSTREVSEAKLFATEAAVEITGDAVQIHGDTATSRSCRSSATSGTPRSVRSGRARARSSSTSSAASSGSTPRRHLICVGARSAPASLRGHARLDCATVSEEVVVLVSRVKRWPATHPAPNSVTVRSAEEDRSGPVWRHRVVDPVDVETTGLEACWASPAGEAPLTRTLSIAMLMAKMATS